MFVFVFLDFLQIKSRLYSFSQPPDKTGILRFFGIKAMPLVFLLKFVRHTFLEKMISVRRTNIPSWEIAILFDEPKRRPLENFDLFDEQKNLPGKLVSVR